LGLSQFKNTGLYDTKKSIHEANGHPIFIDIQLILTDLRQHPLWPH
jgi:hypothetical protein